MKRRKLNKTNLIILLVTLFFCITFVYSSIQIFTYLKNNAENRKIQSLTNDYVKVDNNELEEEYSIDFIRLKEENPDTVGYLMVEGTNIDYIVVKGKDNDYYLHHNFYKNYNVSGWVFMDYRNKNNGSDKNTVIYGHNTRDGSMFGTLKNTLTSEWQNKSNKILLATEYGVSYYQVFSTYDILAEDYYITTFFKTDEEYQEFLTTIKSRSNHDYNVDLSIDDSILTLSSCVPGGKERVVLHAKKLV